jgi:hypothetical protein
VTGEGGAKTPWRSEVGFSGASLLNWCVIMVPLTKHISFMPVKSLVPAGHPATSNAISMPVTTVALVTTSRCMCQVD